MFFSNEMSLKDFIDNHYDNDEGYRLTLDTRNNTCKFADIKFIRVPSFKNCMPIDIFDFEEMMLSRKMTWPNGSRFKYLYVYVIGEEVYICDRDNIEISNFKEEYFKLTDEFKSIRRPLCIEMPNGF